MKIPTAATSIIVLKEAAFAPIAELRKFTASLLTPTIKSMIARINRKIRIPRNIVLIKVCSLFVFKVMQNYFKDVIITCHKYYKTVTM